MWRSRFEEDWERRKLYLIRSLFEDLPPLSPVPEEDESFDSPRRSTHPLQPYNAPKPSSRPHSPLPPLIIEIEPNRHDEPEEYYRKLEKRILKVYRKLFIEGKSDISSDLAIGTDISEDEENDMEDQDSSLDNLQNTAIIEMAEASDSTVEDQDSISIDEHDINFNKLSVEIYDYNNSDNNSSRGLDEEYNETHKHNTRKECLVESVSDIETSQKSNRTVSEKGQKRSIEQDNETSKSKKSKSTDTSNEIQSESDKSKTTSSHSRLDSKTDESGMQGNDFRDYRIVEVLADIHTHPNKEAQPAFQFVSSKADEEIVENNGGPDNISSSSSGKRSWSSMSEESVTHEEAGTQTCINYERINQNILRDIFVGPPKVFRLCSCVNHICVC